MLKKISGFVFVALAIILSISFVQRFNEFISSILGVLQIATDNPEAFKAWYNIGTMTYWVIHIGLTTVFWIFGLRWTKRRQ